LAEALSALTGVIARLDPAIQYSQPVFTGSPAQAGRWQQRDARPEWM